MRSHWTSLTARTPAGKPCSFPSQKRANNTIQFHIKFDWSLDTAAAAAACSGEDEKRENEKEGENQLASKLVFFVSLSTRFALSFYFIFYFLFHSYDLRVQPLTWTNLSAFFYYVIYVCLNFHLSRWDELISLYKVTILQCVFKSWLSNICFVFQTWLS